MTEEQNSDNGHTTKSILPLILSNLLVVIIFIIFVYILLFGSFSSFGGKPRIPEEYFIPFLMGAIIVFSIIVILSIHYAQKYTSNPNPLLKRDDFNGANSLRVMATGATIASLTFTIYIITEKTLGLGFLRILIIPSLSSSILSTLAFIFRRFRPELLFTAILLLLAVFIMFIFILPQFF